MNGFIRRILAVVPWPLPGKTGDSVPARALPRSRLIPVCPCSPTEIAPGNGAVLDKGGRLLGGWKHLIA